MYKVVIRTPDNTLVSAVVRLREITTVYQSGQWTAPTLLCSKLFVFSDYDSALKFTREQIASHLRANQHIPKYEIWKAQARGVDSLGNVLIPGYNTTADTYRQYWYGENRSNFMLIPVPLGTRTARRVKLVKKVYPAGDTQ